jgi:hypothetical protein
MHRDGGVSERDLHSLGMSCWRIELTGSTAFWHLATTPVEVSAFPAFERTPPNEPFVCWM